MFKLKKILGARSSVPEICMWENDATAYIRSGSLYVVRENTLSNEHIEDFPDHLKIIAMMSAEDDGVAIPIAGFAITSDMIFEADLKSAPTPVSIGEKVNIVYDDEGNLAAVASAENAHDAIVVNSTFCRQGKVDIIFI